MQVCVWSLLRREFSGHPVYNKQQGEKSQQIKKKKQKPFDLCKAKEIVCPK